MSDRSHSRARRIGAAAAAFGLATLVSGTAGADDGNIYSTYGAHNPPKYSNCDTPDCIAKRSPTDPSDPRWPEYWSTEWTMYRVFNGYAENPPPYNGKPPAALVEGKDYQASQGATYYDSTIKTPNGQGAMMEHYEKKCLPIFPLVNDFTCSFVSLGNTAYVLTYEEDRPKDMPPCCLFSPLNHPPEPDFIKHLPYSTGDSKRLDNTVQGYSFWVDAASGKPIQVGVSPDRTQDGAIMFGYGFMSTPTPDSANPSAEPYRHPQSFYFSGYPLDKDQYGRPATPAPMVSQNFKNFSMTRPDPAKTWDQVGKMCTGNVPACQLFEPPPPSSEGKLVGASAAGVPAPTWNSIGRYKK